MKLGPALVRHTRVASWPRPNRWQLLSPVGEWHVTVLKIRSLGAIVVALAIGLSSCTAPPTPEYESVIGLTLLDATPVLPNDLRIYDLSIPLLDIAPAYDGGEPAGRWVIVAQCPEIDAGAIGIVPIDEYTGGIKATAVEQGWNYALLECSE